MKKIKNAIVGTLQGVSNWINQFDSKNDALIKGMLFGAVFGVTVIAMCIGFLAMCAFIATHASLFVALAIVFGIFIVWCSVWFGIKSRDIYIRRKECEPTGARDTEDIEILATENTSQEDWKYGQW